MINFLLNNKNVSTELPSSMVVLDFLRHSRRLVGTKEGCREGRKNAQGGAKFQFDTSIREKRFSVNANLFWCFV
jgi:xanthine dehydrogenase iron-sulfur cluster and FAD-binding subunit A